MAEKCKNMIGEWQYVQKKIVLSFAAPTPTHRIFKWKYCHWRAKNDMMSCDYDGLAVQVIQVGIIFFFFKLCHDIANSYRIIASGQLLPGHLLANIHCAITTVTVKVIMSNQSGNVYVFNWLSVWPRWKLFYELSTCAQCITHFFSNNHNVAALRFPKWQ